ncbi:LysE family translocator [Salidesulfovibrio onnuriiensis]|uniref:LysE family translocator n=1 Tax=Salidesulfovibrio onnuriiensis TaxID=2583823 RepID=UPI0011C7AC83|nr:LysE family translocator [Salidesulfovibrio onnuriiensis]
MTIEGAIGLALATLVFAVIPGPGVTALVAQSLARGFTHGVFWGTGLVMGDFVYLMLAMFGMGWVASQMGEAFIVLKILGAVYLFYLGVRCWLAKPPTGVAEPVVTHRRYSRTLLGGMCVSLSNPKVIAFYCGFLPGFVDMATLTGTDMALVVSIILPIVFLAMVCYAWLAAKGRQAAQSTRLWKIANRSAGAVMIGAGVAVVAE